MTIEAFLLEYGSTLAGCFGAGFGLGYYWLGFKQALDIIT